MEPPLTRAPSTPKPTRAFQDMDLPRLARLLDASSVLGPCRDLASLGPTLFKLLREDLAVDRLALWFGEPGEGLEVVQWAAQLGPDGVLARMDPVAGWWSTPATCRKTSGAWRAGARAARRRCPPRCGASSRPRSCCRCAPPSGWWAA